jgi:hypothetical protein
MEGAIRRIWWSVGIAGALALVIAVVLVVQARREADAAPVSASSSAAPSRPAKATVGEAPGPVVTATRDAPVAARQADGRRPGARVVEVCGMDPVRLSSAAGDEENEQQLDDAVARASVPWADMQASADERVRAAGFALAGRIEPLAKLASQTRDATVYAMAQSTCVRVANDPAAAQPADQAWCETLDANKRAALEPDNAAAWLQVAAEAEARQDAAGVDEALGRAAAASTLVHHTMAAVMQVERFAGASARASQVSLWVHRAFDDAGAHAPLLPASVCAPERQGLPGRREVCQQLAQRLLDRPHAIGDLALGLVLARQVGVDEVIVGRKREELEAVQAAEAARLDAWSGADRYACATLANKRDWLRKHHQQGEWSSARDAALAKAGSLDALLRQHRESAASQQPRQAERR